MPNPLYRAERCRDLPEDHRTTALCASTEMLNHYSRIAEHHSTLAEAEELDVLACLQALAASTVPT